MSGETRTHESPSFVFEIRAARTGFTQHIWVEVNHKAGKKLHYSYYIRLLNQVFLLDVFSFVTCCLMRNCVCVFKPSGKGKRLPEVHCIVSKLGCFNLFAKVSKGHKRPLPSFSLYRGESSCCSWSWELITWKSVGAARLSLLCLCPNLFFPLAKWNVKPLRVNICPGGEVDVMFALLCSH